MVDLGRRADFSTWMGVEVDVTVLAFSLLQSILIFHSIPAVVAIALNNNAFHVTAMHSS